MGRKFIILSIILIFTAFGTVLAQERGMRIKQNDLIVGKYYALLIGIQDYEDNSLDLEYPLKDVQNIKDILTNDYTFEENNVLLLRNPSRKDIIKALEDLRRKSTEQDNLLIYYSGHGFWDEGMKQGYWIPSNASPDDPTE